MRWALLRFFTMGFFPLLLVSRGGGLVARPLCWRHGVETGTTCLSFPNKGGGLEGKRSRAHPRCVGETADIGGRGGNDTGGPVPESSGLGAGRTRSGRPDKRGRVGAGSGAPGVAGTERRSELLWDWTMELPLLALLGLGLVCQEGQGLVPPNELKQLSAAGSKYIDAEVENAINGVKQMKTLMDKTSKEHQAMLHTLEETKKKKEEAVKLALEKEKQLAEKQEVCNETMLSLWEECKPCLKHTCMRVYSKMCHSGSGLVGRQLEEFLNRSSPFSIWVNGERIDDLLDREQRQERRFEDLEERFGLMEDGVEDIFQDSTQLYGPTFPFFRTPPFGGFREAFVPPVQRVHLVPRRRLSRELHPFFQHPMHGFHRLFQPLFEMTQHMLDGGHGAWEHPLGGFATESRNFSTDRMVCREIRRNSAGCLRMRDECEKCREILAVDCSQTDPVQSQLREQFEDALRLAERFTRRYDDLLSAFQAEMLNTSSLLDQLNRQFGWVSRLGNLTQGNDGFLQVTTVFSKTPNLEDPSAPADTQVTVQLFDSEPLSLTVPGDISWDDPRFMEIVAEQALQHYKQNNTIE